MRSFPLYQSNNASGYSNNAATRSRRFGRSVANHGRRVGAAALVGALALCLTAGADSPAAAETAPQSLTGPLGPISDWLDDLVDDVDDIRDDLDTAASMVLDAQLPLDASTAKSLTTLLNAVEASIDRVLDPRLEPSLWPADAGAVDESITPDSLTEYAATCAELAAEAVEALQPVQVDAHCIGSRFHTIRALLGGYRAAAGIE